MAKYRNDAPSYKKMNDTENSLNDEVKTTVSKDSESDIRNLALKCIAGVYGMNAPEIRTKLNALGHDADKILEAKDAILAGSYFV